MYSYLYDNKFLLWITVIFMFIGVITVTIITYMFIFVNRINFIILGGF